MIDMFSKKNLLQLEKYRDEYALEFQPFESTNTLLLQFSQYETWIIEYYEEKQRKLNKLYNEKTETEKTLKSIPLDEKRVRKRLTSKINKINESIKKSRPYCILHQNKKRDTDKFHTQRWVTNLYHALDSIVNHKGIMVNLNGSPNTYNKNKINNITKGGFLMVHLLNRLIRFIVYSISQ